MTVRRIAVFRALQLGDMLCAVPALRALRVACPQAEITLISLPWAASFAKRFSRYVDAFVAFPGMEGFPEQAPQPGALPAFIRAMREQQFDLALQIHGSGSLSNPLVASFGAARMAGFHPPGVTPADRASFIEWDDEQNEVLRFLDLLEKLGVPACSSQLEFPLTAADYADLESAAPALAERGDYLCIHPGARMPSRRWPAARFAEVATLAARQGLQVVVTGSADEADLVQAVLAGIDPALRSRVLDLGGRTSLGGMAALVAGARLLVCNDTGVSHIAAAVATPSVVVCSGANPRRWAPLDTVRHRVLWAAMPCRPCMHVACPFDDHPCATAVSVSAVWQAAQAALASRGPVPQAMTG